MYSSVVKGKSVYTWKNLEKLGLNPKHKMQQRDQKKFKREWNPTRKSKNDLE
jgi:hypothetical protein